MVFSASPTNLDPDPRPNPQDRRKANRREEDRRLSYFYQEQSRRLQSLLELGRMITLDLKLETLLTQIAQKAVEIVKADRCSVFLYDSKTDELWSTVALGLEDQTIRLPAGTGLAGACFQSGQPINLSEVYQDPRFNPEVDSRTGYRTRSLCCLPIRNRDKTVIGVIQLLNKEEGGFTEEDLSFLQTFGNQAAVFLEMAQLQRARIEALEQAQDELRGLNRAKDKALNHLSHELCTPLSVIQGNIRLLRRKIDGQSLTPIKPEIFQSLEKNLDRLLEIQRETDQIVRTHQELEDHWFLKEGDRRLTLHQQERELPEELLTYWQILKSWMNEQDGIRRSAFIKRVMLFPFLRLLLENLKVQAGQREIVFDLRGPDDLLWPVEPRSLGDALASLVKNAVENTPDGGRIEVSIEEQDRKVVLGVRDTGIGIRGEDQKYLFDGLFHTQETDLYTSKKPFEFNAGGKGLDLLRTRLAGRRFGFEVDVQSGRCSHLTQKEDLCPGKISLCRFCRGPEDCLDNGGSLFTLTFSVPEGEFENLSEASVASGAL
jgi:signal transduction histidine kinase